MVAFKILSTVLRNITTLVFGCVRSCHECQSCKSTWLKYIWKYNCGILNAYNPILSTEDWFVWSPTIHYSWKEIYIDGSRFILQISYCISHARVAQELCKTLQNPQQFTPRFVHHCLGEYEGTRANLANRLTPSMKARCSNW